MQGVVVVMYTEYMYRDKVKLSDFNALIAKANVVHGGGIPSIAPYGVIDGYTLASIHTAYETACGIIGETPFTYEGGYIGKVIESAYYNEYVRVINTAYFYATLESKVYAGEMYAGERGAV